MLILDISTLPIPKIPAIHPSLYGLGTGAALLDTSTLQGQSYSIIIQGGREISAIIVTVDYLCYKEPESPYNFFFSYFNI